MAKPSPNQIKLAAGIAFVLAIAVSVTICTVLNNFRTRTARMRRVRPVMDDSWRLQKIAQTCPQGEFSKGPVAPCPSQDPIAAIDPEPPLPEAGDAQEEPARQNAGAAMQAAVEHRALMQVTGEMPDPQRSSASEANITYDAAQLRAARESLYAEAYGSLRPLDDDDSFVAMSLPEPADPTSADTAAGASK